ASRRASLSSPIVSDMLSASCGAGPATAATFGHSVASYKGARLCGGRPGRARGAPPAVVTRGTARGAAHPQTHPVTAARRAPQTQETTMTIQVIGGFVYGTHGADEFHGSFWSDTYVMTADDFVTDIVDGGGGEDTVDYSQSDVGVRITLT